MNFNEFCENDDNILNYDNDRFQKYNEKLRKNTKKTQKNEQNYDNLSINSNFNSEINNKLDETEILKKIEKYKNMNQSQLLSELLNETNKQKQNGNLDNKKLEDIKSSLSDVLTNEQKSRLDELIKMLR